MGRYSAASRDDRGRLPAPLPLAATDTGGPPFASSAQEGLFHDGARFANAENGVRGSFANLDPHLPTFEAQFGVAYAEAQVGPLATKLQALLKQIGFYRSAATACLLALLATVFFNVAPVRSHLPLLWWRCFATPWCARPPTSN